MTSELKVDKITPASGTDTQIGEAGDTTNLSAGTVTLPTSIITGQSAKTSLADADKFLISDSAASGAFKYVESQYIGGGGLNHIITTTVSSGGSGVSDVTFLNGSGGVTLDGTYNTYLVTGTGVGVATDDTSLIFRVSINSGSNYNSQIYLTHHIVETTFGNNSASSGASGQSVSGPAQMFAGAQGSASGETVNFEMKLFDVGSTSNKKAFTYVSVEHQYNNIVKVRHGGGIIAEASNAIDGIRFAAGSGNITEGEFSLYGLAKS